MERRWLWNCAQRKWNTAGSGTREALMEHVETRFSANGTPQALACSLAPYPYSKMCELCELCELFVKILLSKLSALSSRTAHS